MIKVLFLLSLLTPNIQYISQSANAIKEYHSFNYSGNKTIESKVYFHDDCIEYYESKMIATNNLYKINIKTYHIIIYAFPQCIGVLEPINADSQSSKIVEHEYLYEYTELGLL